MKSYIDFLLENEILSEEVIPLGNFEIGFELEGYIGNEDNPLKDYIRKRAEENNKTSIIQWLEDDDGLFPKYLVYPYITEYMMHDLLDGMNESELIVKKAKTENDSSLKNDEEHCPFEFDSPVFPCTYKWMNKIISCLQKWLKEGSIYTDEHCGFHNHISWKGMTEEDRAWAYCQMAVDFDKIEELFSQLKCGEDKKDSYNFISRYASTDKIQEMKDAINGLDFGKVKELLDTEKFSFFNLHPDYGTIEWRGPRDFMNEGKIENIQKFYNLLRRLLGTISRLQNKEEIKAGNGHTLSREDFFEEIETSISKDNLEDVEKFEELKDINILDFSDLEISKKEYIEDNIVSYDNKNYKVTIEGYDIEASDFSIDNGTIKAEVRNCDFNISGYNSSSYFKNVSFVSCEFYCKKISFYNCKFHRDYFSQSFNAVEKTIQFDNCIFNTNVSVDYTPIRNRGVDIYNCKFNYKLYISLDGSLYGRNFQFGCEELPLENCEINHLAIYEKCIDVAKKDHPESIVNFAKYLLENNSIKKLEINSVEINEEKIEELEKMKKEELYNLFFGA